MMESFKAETRIALEHVPYQGAGPAVAALLADQVDSMMLPVGVALSQGGRLKILGIASHARFPAALDVPTLREQGIELAGDLWLALLAPPGTPEAVAERLAQEVGRFVSAPEAADFLTPNGLVADTADQARFIAYLELDFGAFWGIKQRRTSVRPGAAGGAAVFRRFVRVPAKSDNPPATGSGLLLPRPRGCA
jgi:tripartite-type tricarboxylate transporter receptor subunit TctC